MNTLRTRIIDRRITGSTILRLQLLATSTSTSPSAKTSTPEIQIPIRKERGPTDILRALESTISRDPTAPDYKYIDDPFLIPYSLSKKRMYSLAKESGKRAAMWILQEHPDLLKSNLSDPLIHAFLPREKYTEKSQVSEEILLELIRQGNVADVIYVYNLLDGKISNRAKQEVLEILCFYNSKTDQISTEFLEERSYQIYPEINKNEWRESPLVEQLFLELKNNKETAERAYNALICGAAKYMAVDKAWKLYVECLANDIALTVTSYNHLMGLVPLLKDNNEDRKVLIMTLLQKMVDNRIKPNISTLNAALKSITVFTSYSFAKSLAMSLVVEFKNIGIEPSLGTYYYLLIIFCQKSNITSNILLEILNELEKKDELVMQDPMDKNFFVQAMEVASTHLHSMSAGDRIHKLLLTKNNYQLIGGRLKESVYYRNYVQLVLSSETIDEFMKVYNALVPNIYIPEPAVIRDILQMLELNEKNKAMEILPTLLSHIIMFDMLDRHQIMKLIFGLMTKYCSPPKDSPLNQTYFNFALSLWTHIQNINKIRLQRTMWPGVVLGNMAVLMIRGNAFEKMLEVLSYLVKSQDAVFATMNPDNLQEIFDACLTRGHVEGATDAVKYAVEYGIADANTMAKIMKDTLPLSEMQENELINLVGVKNMK